MKRASSLSTVVVAISLWMPALVGAKAQVQKTDVAVPAAGLAQVRFDYEHTGVSVPQFMLDVDEAGRGTYHAQVMGRPNSPNSGYEMITQPVQISAATRAMIFSTARSLNFFQYPCDYKKNKVAYQGIKKLAYSGPDGNGECVYNWSHNRQLQQLTDLFLGISFTLNEGRKLRLLHEYDRLGLDEEMQEFAAQVHDGSAREIANIRDVLQSIANDPELIRRVRVQATELLEQAEK
ncbi:MAG: hypothetical protein ACYC46_05770 [Acidobacteriaceae bacterium]